MNTNNMYIQIDDFYKEPHLVRELSLQTDYHEQGALSYNVAGIESKVSAHSQSIIRKFESILDKKIICESRKNAFGRFRIMCHGDKRRTRVHTDNTEFTAVVHLSLDKDSLGGTYFYKHKETNLNHYPNSLELQTLGVTKEEFDEHVVLKDSLNPNAWEVIDFCEVKFNRCVILRGKQFFHGSNCFFGETRENARITQNFFFNTK